MNLGHSVRRYLITGFIIVAPIAITVFLLVSFVTMLDYFLKPVAHMALGREVPGMGFLLLLVLVGVAGWFGSGIKGKHVLEWVESRLLLHIPVFNWLYRTIKQLTEVFSPTGSVQFKSVALIEYPRPGVYSVGFVTNRVEFERADGRKEELYCAYVATNHVYIGDVVLVPKEKLIDTRMSLQDGFQFYLSAGATFPKHVAQQKN